MALLGTNFKTYNKLIPGEMASIFLHPSFLPLFSLFPLISYKRITRRKTTICLTVNGLA